MAVETGIAWTDATFNPRIGCTKVGPGCDHCYAENLATNRLNVGWGPGAERRRTAPANWAKPLRWNKARAAGQTHFTGKDRAKVPLWVFCASLADWLDNEVPAEWLRDLLDLISQCRHLRWQLCTKRIPALGKRLSDVMLGPEDWFPSNPHVGVLITAVNQEEADRDIPRALQIKSRYGIRWVGLSVEPQVGFIRLADHWLAPRAAAWSVDWSGIDWVICGGESAQGAPARRFDWDWGRGLATQCAWAHVPFFMKQLGSNAGTMRDGEWIPLRTRDRAGADPEEWPDSIRVRQMPKVYDREPQASLFA